MEDTLSFWSPTARSVVVPYLLRCGEPGLPSGGEVGWEVSPEL